MRQSPAVLPMTTFRAEQIARDTHAGQRDRDGLSHVLHVERVVMMVPEWCERAAWLHDVVEDGEWTVNRLQVAGLPIEDCAAVSLLTRSQQQSYADYIDAIADYRSDDGGYMARIIKEADLVDNLRRSLIAGDMGPIDRYRKALRTIQGVLLYG